jgi:hypothetical protein
MDCGHGGLCYDCAIKIWKTKGDCFLCRNVILIIYLMQKIESVLQIDLESKKGSYLKVITSTQKA